MTHLQKHKKIYIGLLLALYIAVFSISIAFAANDSAFDVDAGGAEDTHGFDADPYTYDTIHALGAPTERVKQGYSMGSPEWFFELIVKYSSTSQVTDVDKSLDSFNAAINAVMAKVCDNICKPLGYAILTLFALFEIFNIFTARDALKGEAILHSMFKMLIRLVIAKALVDNSKTLLYAIFDIVLMVIQNAKGFIDANPAAAASLDSFMSELGQLSTFERLSASAVLFVAWLCVVGANVICKVIVAGRFIAIYILIAVSPIPLAFFSNEGQSEIGKTFLKRFFAECLQGFLIYLVISIFPYIFSNLTDITSMQESMTSWLIGCVVNSLVLISAVKSTNALAKGIVNVM